MTPNQLLEYAHVPSFSETMTHQKIAAGLKNPPIDNWQRPLDTDRIELIRIQVDGAQKSNSEKDTLMANPVLIGKSDQWDNDVKVKDEQLKEKVGNTEYTVPGVWKLTLSSKGDLKPLWILDGQHRIHGLGDSELLVDDGGKHIPNSSIVANQTIPVVFVIHGIYTQTFLAKIFTEVTTKAEPMKPLHGDWMEYAFKFGDYENNDSAQKAMRAVIELNTMQKVDGLDNEFMNNIQYNPFKKPAAVGPLDLDATKFRSFLQNKYYDLGGKGGYVELTEAFVRFFRAAMNKDSKSSTTSRLMSTNNLSKLSLSFFGAFLEHLANNAPLITNSLKDWEDFLTEKDAKTGAPIRRFDDSDWELPTVSPNSTQSNDAYKASDKAADVTWNYFFEKPTKLGGLDPAEFMLSPGDIKYDTAVLSGKFPPKNHTPGTTTASGGSQQIKLMKLGHKMIRFKSLDTSQCTITKIERKNKTTKEWDKVKVGASITLYPGTNTEEIKVYTMSYGSDSAEITSMKIMS